MDEAELLAQRFEEHRGRLRAVAYRLLGSPSEADDAVQEAWLRLSRTDAGDIENLVEAFLAAARDGDFDRLLAVLDPDVVRRAGSETGAARKRRETLLRRDLALLLGRTPEPEPLGGRSTDSLGTPLPLYCGLMERVAALVNLAGQLVDCRPTAANSGAAAPSPTDPVEKSTRSGSLVRLG